MTCKCKSNGCNVCGESKGLIMGMGSGDGTDYICGDCMDKVFYYHLLPSERVFKSWWDKVQQRFQNSYYKKLMEGERPYEEF